MEKILNKIMVFLSKEEELDSEQAEIVRYGLEILLLKSIFFLATLALGLLIGCFWACFLFMAFFVPLRSFAGGYHADTRKQCLIQSMLTKESPEIIRFFRNIESLSEILDTQAEKMRPVLNGERYMTDSELAEHLKLTRRTLAEYRITGKLPYYKVGGKLLYKEKDILVLLERNRMEAFDYR